MKRKRRKNRTNATGRNETSHFVRLDYRTLTSNAYRALSPNARALLIELGMLYNGYNNGSLYLSIRDAAARIGVVDLNSAIKAFDDLQRLGFIEMTRDAYFNIKTAEGSRARCWRLKWLAGPGRKLPDHSLKDHEPAPKTRERARMERGLRALKAYRKRRDGNRLPVLDSETLEAIEPDLGIKAVADSQTFELTIVANPPIMVDRHSKTHIAITMGDVHSKEVWARNNATLPFPFSPNSKEAPDWQAVRFFPFLEQSAHSKLSNWPNFGGQAKIILRRAANDNSAEK